MVSNPYNLPPGLPVPEDDGACRHLDGLSMPAVRLKSSRGREVDVTVISAAPMVMFFYPSATGRPDTPPEWDLIPGARGCTAQACTYRDRYREFGDLGVSVHGVSAQSPQQQREFAERMGIPYELLSDSDFALTNALRLPTFDFQGRRYIKRLALVVADRRITKVFYPIFPPDTNADAVLAYFRGK